MKAEGWIDVWPSSGPVRYYQPPLWCDLCGYGVHSLPVNAPHHFCHRHKEKEIQKFLAGEKPGYFQLKEQEQQANDQHPTASRR